jgi:hypothetical protein
VDSTWRVALRWLTHPTTCLALAVLLLNDHVLKQAYGTWWTGKLSDVAGLVLAPPLLAVLIALVPGVRVDPRRLVTVGTVTVGIGFTVAKATTLGAATASAVWTLLAGDSLVRRDPTDLLTLPALLIALTAGRRLARTAAEPTDSRRPVPARWVVVLPLAVLATTATSGPADPDARDVQVRDGAVVVTGAGSQLWASADLVTWEQVKEPRLPNPTSAPTEDPIQDPDAEPTVDPSTDASTTDTGEPHSAPVCAPDGLLCFRAESTATIGVQRSDDGGLTWQDDWHLSDADRAALLDRYTSVSPEELVTMAVAILPGPGTDVRAVAANGRDGIAVRDADGTWHRLGHVYQGDTTVIPLASERGRPDFPLPEGLVLGLLAAALVLAVARPASPRLPARVALSPAAAVAHATVPAGGLVHAQTDHTTGRRVLGTVAALALLGTALLQLGTGAFTGQEGIIFPAVLRLIAALLAVGTAICLVAAAALSGRALALVPAILTGALVTALWGQLAPDRLALWGTPALVVLGCALARALPRR